MLALLCAASCIGVACAQPPRSVTWKIVRTLPHDRAHFTQGLALDGGRFIESAGQYGRSALYEKEIESGRVLRAHANDARVFAEGVTVRGARIVQLTWREGLAIVYDRALRPLATLRYDGEGWGLAHDGAALITSDGSSHLAFRDPETLRVLRRLEVRENGAPLALLNELEFARGLVWANVWLSDRIVAIDPRSGAVVAALDLAALHARLPAPVDRAAGHVLNGIAHDPATDRFYVTGKCWPALFELEVGAPERGLTAAPGRAGL